MEGEAVDGGAERSTTELTRGLRTLPQPCDVGPRLGPERDATLHGGGAEQVVRRWIEPIVIDRVIIGELARAAQEAKHAGADRSDEPLDVGIGDVGDGMEVGIRLAERTCEGAVDPETSNGGRTVFGGR